jgi:hypothetical protein
MRTFGDPGPRHARGPAPADVRLLAQHLTAFNRIGTLAQIRRRLGDLDRAQLRAICDLDLSELDSGPALRSKGFQLRFRLTLWNRPSTHAGLLRDVREAAALFG